MRISFFLTIAYLRERERERTKKRMKERKKQRKKKKSCKTISDVKLILFLLSVYVVCMHILRDGERSDREKMDERIEQRER